MDLTIYPGKLSGTIAAIPSKSQAHRLLICAAFSDKPTILYCSDTNQDIEATASCLNQLGAKITRTADAYHVQPIKEIPSFAEIDCWESGSTLRFMLPIVCALGVDTVIHMSGRLPYRPLSPMWEELERMGCVLTRPTETTIRTSGKLRSGEYTIAGNISSQFISGLLFALSLLDGSSCLNVTGTMESKPYIDMTQKALAAFGVDTSGFRIHPHKPLRTPGELTVEGDWSNAAFFLTAAALGNPITVENLDVTSSQGDRIIVDILQLEQDMPTICAADIPDLVPIMAVYFAANQGAVFTNISRLRLKESDRVTSVIAMLNALGIRAEADDTTMRVYGGQFTGGIVNSCNDHRIAMAAAIAATAASGPITILGAECVAKSYPAFWAEYRRLGGNYEQYIR
ncbi:MAG: 3-phosphoshikimate 1-carboxyvinyltransferase [Oscillospiraceae bacterium]|nr:3-phosphoshikimate 1-carboxyvinyltransferase [Oscillospiraceae bacterium]